MAYLIREGKIMDFSIFTPEHLQKAREYAAAPSLRYAKAILNNDTYNAPFADHVTDERKQLLYKEQLQLVDNILNGNSDHNFTIRQRMYYYLTGESVAFLP